MSFYPKICCLILLLLCPLYACAANISAPKIPFALWLEGVKKEAASQGISQATLESAFLHVVINPRIIELDRKQPEKRKTFQQYFTGAITDARVKQARMLYRKHYALLTEIGAHYGVQPSFIVSLWGIETSFGANTGKVKLIDALTTLAYDGRRSEFFRKELIESLKILDQRHFTADTLRGSWAGAMGQTQFMPSSYFSYAVDYNKDGFADIWNDPADIFASIANYLATVGWDMNSPWGRKVLLPAHFDPELAGMEQSRPISAWGSMGIRSKDGSRLPSKPLLASLIILGENGQDAYLVYNNYKTLLDWNKSKYFATTVSLFADKIEGK